LFVFFNLILPGDIEKVADLLDAKGTPSPEQLTSANLHIYAGFAILALTILRLILRLVRGAPDSPPEEPMIFKLLAKATHATLYLVLLAMPLAGIAKFYFHIDAAGFVHGGPLKLLLWLLIAGHIAGVFVHQFYWKTNILDRMTRG
jgi:cytochrome b561